MRFFISLVSTSLRSSLSLRGLFLFEFFLMVFNNLLFFSLWWLFFNRFHEINGWEFQDMTALFVIGTGGYGVMLVFFGGVRHLCRIIVNGELDIFLTHPKPLLVHIVGSRCVAKGWGDIITALLLIAASGFNRPGVIAMLLFAIFLAALVFTAVGIITHSLAFWLGPVEHLAKQYCDAVAILTMYPPNIYTGILKVMMFTCLPAGVIGYLPVELIKDPTLLKFIVMCLSSLSFVGMAVLVFNLGLKRYESGNQFLVR